MVELVEGLTVRRVYCVGKNYDAHAAEMGWQGREPPFYFTKFPDTLVAAGGTIPYPPRTQDFHYEGELVAVLGRPAFRVAAENALAHVAGYAAGLDMTRRDLQRVAREAGRPWDLGKNFDAAAVVGPFTPAAAFPDPTAGRLTLTQNGELRQSADLSEMIWSLAEVIADLSSFGPLAAGDVIFTGTPAGVGPVLPGDRLEVTVAGLAPCAVTIGDRV